MMSVKISIPYFPLAMRYTAIALLLGSGWLAYIGYYKVAVVMVILCIFIFTAKYITTIDLNKHEYIDAFGFFGIGLQTEKKTFDKINHIVVTKGHYVHNINTRSSSRTLDWSDYTGTLIYDDTGELTLVTHQDKAALMKTLYVYATALKCEIEDRSVRRT
jgi:hypothetical protein